jgi:threonine/homoserine/homoserine lactone efflux protein
MLSYLIIGISYGFAAAVQPGPLQSYFISQSLSKGWRHTLPAAFAPLISDGPIIAIVLLLVNQVPPWLITSLQFAGGVFLLYLAVHTWKTWKNYNSEDLQVNQSSQQNLIQATFVNFLNPAPYLGWSLIMGPLLLKGWRENPTYGIELLVGFYAVLVIVSIAIIVLFASTKKFGLRITRISIGISAIVLGCFGIFQLWSSASYFWNIVQ